MNQKYIIYGEKQGIREDYKPERGEEAVKEEVKRLNGVDDGVKYGYRKVDQSKPENPQANRFY